MTGEIIMPLIFLVVGFCIGHKKTRERIKKWFNKSVTSDYKGFEK